MNHLIKGFLIACAILALYSAMHIAAAQPVQTLYGATLDDEIDYRYRLVPQRYSNGTLKRSQRVLNAFVLQHPCPSNHLPDTSCPGWALNHDAALACGGIDMVSNLSWIKDEYKTGYAILSDGTVAPMGYMDHGKFIDMSSYAIDRVERRIGALIPPVDDTPTCRSESVP